MEESGSSLCFPDGRKSCFACCPPIRPAGYDHMDHLRIIQRMLRENTHAFDASAEAVVPITGFSCWALGYLDSGYRLVGCLLHPARHGGVDLRYRVHYGEKCRREKCPQAVEFERLSPQARRFFLYLTEGLDSFAYSSRRVNPLFSLLDWGAEGLERLVGWADGEISGARELVDFLPFFGTSVKPRAYAYFLETLLERKGLAPLREKVFLERFEAFADGAVRWLRSAVMPMDPSAPFTHSLPLNRRFLDFLRLAAGARRLAPEKAFRIKDVIDAAFENLLQDASEGFCRPLPPL